MIAEAKKKNIPGPGLYKAKGYCGNGVSKAKSGSKEQKFNSFVEHARWKSTQSPGPGNRSDKISHRVIEPRQKAAVMWKEPEKNKHDRFAKIAIDKKTPAMGDYDVTKAFNRTQTRSQNIFASKCKRDSFIDAHVRTKKWLTGPGHYYKKAKDGSKIEIMNCFKQLS